MAYVSEQQAKRSDSSWNLFLVGSLMLISGCALAFGVPGFLIGAGISSLTMALDAAISSYFP